MEGTHSSVPARQPANMIWRQWVLSYTAVICVCVCVCVCRWDCAKETDRVRLRWRERVSQRKEKKKHERDGWMDGWRQWRGISCFWVSQLAVMMPSRISHTHTHRNTQQSYIILWVAGQMVQSVILLLALSSSSSLTKVYCIQINYCNILPCFLRMVPLGSFDSANFW